jgi:PAS domain S-box-containing protein
MKDECDNKVVPFPARLLTGALVLTGVVLVAMLWFAFDREAISSIIALAFCIVLFLFTWLSILRRLNHWRTSQSANVDALTRAEEALRKVNDGLEKRVEDRTRSLQLEIRERKDTEAALRGSDEKFRQLAENITDAFWIRSPDMREVHYISPAFERIWGRSMESLHANPQQWADAILPDDRERVLAVFATLRGAAPSVGMEYRIARPDGEIRWVHVRGFQVRDAAGELIRLTGIVTDITERKRAEQALRESEERFSDAFEHAPIGVALVSPDGRWLKVNRALCELVGYSEAELLTRTFQDITSPEDLEVDLENVRRTLAGEIHSYQIEKRYVHGRGHLVTVLLNVSLVRDGQGEPHYFISQIQDITERKQAEEAMRESEARTQLLVKSSSIGLWDWNLATNEVFFSAEWKSQLGYTDAELPSQFEEWKNRLHPEDREPTLTAVKDYVEGRRADYKVEFRLRHKDGSWRWILTRADLIAGPTGQPARIMGCHIDITERRQMEEQLRKLSCAVEQSPASIVITNTAGEIEYVNPKFTQVTGYGLNEVRGKNPRMLKSNETPIGEYQNMWTTITQGGEWHGEFHNRKKNGELFWEAASVSPIWDDKEQITHFLAVKEDITERKLSEAALEKAHKELLETSRQAGMAEVATSVLHNVGNVLNSVNVASSCLAESLRKSKAANLSKVVTMLREHEGDLGTFLTRDPKGKQLPDYLAQLAEHLAGEQAAALEELDGLQKNIEHIKDIVAMQQSFGQVSGVTETLQVTDLVEEALRMNSPGLHRRAIQVIKEFEAVSPIMVEKHKVLQILVNLVRNAKQACDHPGHAEMRLTLRVTNGNDHVRIAVSDNGVGILPENLTRIFSHGFTTRKDGHGFGLHSGALAAKEMGGSLSVRSDGPGTGATFTLELPLQLLGGANG